MTFYKHTPTHLRHISETGHCENTCHLIEASKLAQTCLGMGGPSGNGTPDL